jgi:ammonium transporter
MSIAIPTTTFCFFHFSHQVRCARAEGLTLRWWLPLILLAMLFVPFTAASAQEIAPKPTEEAKKLSPEEQKRKDRMDKYKQDVDGGDSAWMLVASAFVMLMVPGLALFYGGMVRRKNVLATMMQSMVCLAVVGVYWVAIGYSLAFGEPWINPGGWSFLGFSPKLIFLSGVEPFDPLPGTKIPIYLHMLFQGMFAIITPALISGAIAERIRFKPYCIFLILWVTFVYCPLAHGVWAQDYWDSNAKPPGTSPVGFLGAMGPKVFPDAGLTGALDFAGGTVVHIAAGFSSLAAILILRKRIGYPEHPIHPNSMVLTLAGAGLLWFGWFGFNGGSGLGSGGLATSAFAATQAAAAAAGLSWMLVEWVHRGKPTALGLASGIVAGLVAVTPASGFVYPWGGLIIGLLAGVVCYVSVNLKPFLKYDDSLDAFGVHGVGGFLGAVLTGVFCYTWDYLDPAVGADGVVAAHWGPAGFKQLALQFIAAIASAALAFCFSFVLVKIVDAAFGFITSERDEIEGLDHTEHGETGFDLGLAMEAVPQISHEPRPALIPPDGQKRFHVVVDGVPQTELIKAWADLCQPDHKAPPEFKLVYPNMTTVQGNRFLFRGGDQNLMRDSLQKLFQTLSTQARAKIEA